MKSKEIQWLGTSQHGVITWSITMGQHWLSQWLVAWQHQAITWINTDFPLVTSMKILVTTGYTVAYIFKLHKFPCTCTDQLIVCLVHKRCSCSSSMQLWLLHQCNNIYKWHPQGLRQIINSFKILTEADNYIHIIIWVQHTYIPMQQFLLMVLNKITVGLVQRRCSATVLSMQLYLFGTKSMTQKKPRATS